MYFIFCRLFIIGLVPAKRGPSLSKPRFLDFTSCSISTLAVIIVSTDFTDLSVLINSNLCHL